MKKIILHFIFLAMPFIANAQTGCLSGDCINGNEATFRFPNGDTYVGAFKNGKQHGQGTFLWASGEKYIGEWAQGVQEGIGTFYWNNGKSKRGLWKNGDMIQELGQDKMATNPKISDRKTTDLTPKAPQTGCITGDCINGHGTFRFPNDDAYIGQFKNGKQHGQGIFLWASGEKYDGEWSNGLEDGVAIFSWNNKQFQYSLWERGTFVRQLSETEYKKLKAEAAAR